ncbi:MAG: hypothetical protein OXN22_02105 [Deltaproteobacteria bacterium]|nr:hypothetical protein [Deltaproteobacteria bacterium]
MHADQIQRYGGTEGFRDPGLLEAALDGNERVAFAATYTFLAINGARLTADPEEAYAFISALYESGRFRFDELAAWLRRHVGRPPQASGS